MKNSVYITSYNQHKYLTEAIESVLAQTLPPYQIIIVDDCSTDSSRDIISGYANCHQDLIQPIYHETNTGIAKVRSDALQAATGDYVTYVDGDDRLLPTKLEKESKKIKQHPEAKIVFSNTYYIDEKGRQTGLWAEEIKPPEGDVFCHTFSHGFPKNTLFRNELVDYHAWKNIGFHDPNLAIYEDFDMKIRLTKHLSAVYLDEPLNEYRLHQKGLSRVKREKQFTSIDYIFNKNKHLLSDLDDQERENIKNNLSEWVIRLFTNSIQISENSTVEARHCANLLKSIGANPWDKPLEELMEEYLFTLGKAKQMEGRLEDIHNSFSWKVTAPLRTLGKRLFKFNRQP